jgi:predicted ABC-type transport system involved in lysophospholipase L1 biosynthesis ATPase subunit
LDRPNAAAFADFMVDENRRGRTIILVTHDEDLRQLGKRSVPLQRGELAEPQTTCSCVPSRVDRPSRSQ